MVGVQIKLLFKMMILEQALLLRNVMNYATQNHGVRMFYFNIATGIVGTMLRDAQTMVLQEFHIIYKLLTPL